MLRYISSLPDAGRSDFPRRLSVLGSTGSVGCSCLDVVRKNPGSFKVAALAGGRNLELLAQQAREFQPDYIAVLEDESVPVLKEMLGRSASPAIPRILSGSGGYAELAALGEVDMVVAAQSGAAGLFGTYAAVAAGKLIALANKESLVLAGSLIRSLCSRTGAAILPVDSEHNAVFQCLTDRFGAVIGKHSTSLFPPASLPVEQENLSSGISGFESGDVIRIILTASGGPFFGMTRQELAKVEVAQALNHPNWRMGKKITIDSATLMNKGLELIEAHHLFGLEPGRFDVLVHRQSLTHALVEFKDGSLLSHLGSPDMRIPLAHCLGYPHRINSGAARLDLAQAVPLSFSNPDEGAFPCLALAKAAQSAGKGAPVVLNAANECAVEAFLQGKVGFLGIPWLVETALAAHAGMTQACEPASIEDVLALDEETRKRCAEHLKSVSR